MVEERPTNSSFFGLNRMVSHSEVDEGLISIRNTTRLQAIKGRIITKTYNKNGEYVVMGLHNAVVTIVSI